MGEAQRLSIYFEELSAYQYKQRKEQENNTSHTNAPREELIEEFTIPDEEDAE